jgi:hypothetical protein
MHRWFYALGSREGRITLHNLAPNVRSLVEPLLKAIEAQLPSSLTTDRLPVGQPLAGHRTRNQSHLTVEELDYLWKAAMESNATGIAGTSTEVTLPMYGNRETLDSVPREGNSATDWQTFIEKVRDGSFYDYLLKELGQRTGRSTLTRELMKKSVFTVLFSANESTSRLMQRRKAFFSQLFPNVYHLFETFKSQQHRTLALLLQNIESEIFLNRIARRIAQERPDLPIFTIHDSIITTVGNEAFVETIMREELEKATGIRPFLKREYWQTEMLEETINSWESR